MTNTCNQLDKSVRQKSPTEGLIAYCQHEVYRLLWEGGYVHIVGTQLPHGQGQQNNSANNSEQCEIWSK